MGPCYRLMSFYNAVPAYAVAKALINGHALESRASEEDPNVATDASRPPKDSRDDRFWYILAARPPGLPNGLFILKWICEELCSRCLAPGEYLIGKHGSGSVEIKCRNGRRRTFHFFPYQCSFIHPPSIWKTCTAVIEWGEELKQDEWEESLFKPLNCLERKSAENA